MDLKAAMAQANQDAENYKDGKGETTCPKGKSGLIVVVYGDEKGEALKDVDVKAGDRKAKTGPDGLAKYLPIDEGAHKVHVDRPAGNDMLLSPQDVTVQVRKGACGVCPVEIPVGARPELHVMWAHDSKGIEGVEAKLKTGEKVAHAYSAKTGSDGMTQWTEKEPIPAGSYGIAFAFPKDAKYKVFDQDDKPVETIEAAGRRRLIFRVHKGWAKVHVVQDVAGKAEGVAADLKIKTPDQTVKIAKDQGIVEVRDLPVEPPQFEVASLTPDPSGTDAYEVIEVKTE